MSFTHHPYRRFLKRYSVTYNAGQILRFHSVYIRKAGANGTSLLAVSESSRSAGGVTDAPPGDGGKPGAIRVSTFDGTVAGGGWQVNAKRIYRLYTEEGLTVRTKVRVRAARRYRVPETVATAPNQRWSMDFMSVRVADGRWVRILTVVDHFTRECLCLLADQSLTGEKVAAALDPVVLQRGAPRAITVAVNSPVGSWMPGPIEMGSSWILFDPGNPLRIVLSKVSTDGCAMNA
jgi:integrase-like protein